jgi:hypothetical protein
LLPYAVDLDEQKIHVRAPNAVIFLCGGQCSLVSEPTPLSLRDAFLKIIDNPAIKDCELIQAEDITRLTIFSDCYGDILQFETDLAQITELILLFCESPGSLAELGAFSAIKDIAERLLVIIRNKHWIENSFIKLGPLRSLINNHGNNSVCVLDDEDIGIREDSVQSVRIDILKQRLQEPLRLRLEVNREPTTFDPGRPGHVIKLIVGLIQEYGALTIEEITSLLLALQVNNQQARIKSYLLCAKSVEWIVETRKGTKDYFIARNLPDAVTLRLKESAKIKNKKRRRTLIREHWKKFDEPRYRGIIETFGVVP